MLSYIGYTPKENASYTIQYQEAFEFLFNNRDNAKKESKLIDLPLLYLLRHYLELSFKYNIDYFKDFSEKTDYLVKSKDTHDINCLYLGFKLHFDESFKKLKVDKSIKKQINSYFMNLKKLVDILINLDNDGVSFRYSNDKYGSKNIDLETTLNLIEDIGKPYKNCKDLLDYSTNVHNDLLIKG